MREIKIKVTPPLNVITLLMMIGIWTACTEVANDPQAGDNSSAAGEVGSGGLPPLPPGSAGAGASSAGSSAGSLSNTSRPEEICDGVDNDGDGEVDEVGCTCTEELACFAGPSSARGVGACRDGARICDNELFGPCIGSIGPVEETCDNGVDEDCDGQVDECCIEECEEPEVGGTPDIIDPPNDIEGLSEEFTVGENQESRPVDFVMVVDNSGSMDDTVNLVETNLGAFSSRLVQAGIDYRFALIAEQGTDPRDPDVCIPPPMAGPDCSDTDQFVHRDQKIRSNDAFERLLECVDQCDNGAPGIRDFLRAGALLQLIIVTDDESDMNWLDFQAQLGALGFPDFILHGVVGLMNQGCVADQGDQYILGAQETGGELLDICGDDWGVVLDVILDATLTQLQRTFVLAGQPDPSSLQVFVSIGGAPEVEQIGNWSYDAALNAITFADDAELPVGARVVVRYVNP